MKPPDPTPSRRYLEYIRKIVCDEWESIGERRGGDKGVLRHTSGATVYYLTHDGGNDWNGPRNFAAAVQKVCGCRLIEPRGRKRSRKPATDAAATALEAAHRRHHADYWAALDAREKHKAEAARRAEKERELDELVEAAFHAQASLVNDPNNSALRRWYDHIRALYAEALKGEAL